MADPADLGPTWQVLVWAAVWLLTLIGIVTLLTVYLVRRGRRDHPDAN